MSTIETTNHSFRLTHDELRFVVALAGSANRSPIEAVLGFGDEDPGPGADPFASLAARDLVDLDASGPRLDVRLLALASVIAGPSRSVLVGLAVGQETVVVRYVDGRGSRVALQPGPLTVYEVTFLDPEAPLSDMVRDLVAVGAEGTLSDTVEVVVEWEAAATGPRRRAFPTVELQADPAELAAWLAEGALPT
jgi:hypothetical protein